MITSQSKVYFLPASTTAVLLVGFHPVDQLKEIAKMLGNRGYVVKTHALDLVTLRNLPSKPIGLLYIHSHGRLDLKLPPNQPSSDTDAGAELVFGITHCRFGRRRSQQRWGPRRGGASPRTSLRSELWITTQRFTTQIR